MVSIKLGSIPGQGAMLTKVFSGQQVKERHYHVQRIRLPGR
nr:MAG TPA: hypothetical protein [Caudoviricetes sp.]